MIPMMTPHVEVLGEAQNLGDAQILGDAPGAFLENHGLGIVTTD